MSVLRFTGRQGRGLQDLLWLWVVSVLGKRLPIEDPSVFSKCSGKCCKRGPGQTQENYFGKAYTKRQWERGPLCENCSSPMELLFELKVQAVKPRFAR